MYRLRRLRSKKPKDIQAGFELKLARLQSWALTVPTCPGELFGLGFGSIAGGPGAVGF